MAAPSSPGGGIVALDLDTIADRRAELDGRWVEFQAYVSLWKGADFLVALPGRETRSEDGTVRTLCRGTSETNMPVFLKDGLGPLPRRSVDDAGRQPRVRIRAIFRDRAFAVPDHWVSTEWRGYFERAVIVEVADQWCDLHPPAGSGGEQAFDQDPDRRLPPGATSNNAPSRRSGAT